MKETKSITVKMPKQAAATIAEALEPKKAEPATKPATLTELFTNLTHALDDIATYVTEMRARL